MMGCSGVCHIARRQVLCRLSPRRALALALHLAENAIDEGACVPLAQQCERPVAQGACREHTKHHAARVCDGAGIPSPDTGAALYRVCHKMTSVRQLTGVGDRVTGIGVQRVSSGTVKARLRQERVLRWSRPPPVANTATPIGCRGTAGTGERR